MKNTAKVVLLVGNKKHFRGTIYNIQLDQPLVEYFKKQSYRARAASSRLSAQ